MAFDACGFSIFTTNSECYSGFVFGVSNGVVQLATLGMVDIMITIMQLYIFAVLLLVTWLFAKRATRQFSE